MIYKFYHSLPHLFLQRLPLPSEMVAFLIWYVAVVLVFPFTTILLWGPCTLGSCCSVAQSCPTLFDLMDGSTPGFPVPHRLPEFAQARAHALCFLAKANHPEQGALRPLPGWPGPAPSSCAEQRTKQALIPLARVHDCTHARGLLDPGPSDYRHGSQA